MALAQARGGGGRTSVDVSAFICLWLCRFSFLFVFLKTTFPLKAVRQVPEEAKRSLALVVVPGAVLLHALTVPTRTAYLRVTRVRPSFGRKLQRFLFFECSAPTTRQHFLVPDTEGNTVAKTPCVYVCACVSMRVCVRVSEHLSLFLERAMTVKL